MLLYVAKFYCNMFSQCFYICTFQPLHLSSQSQLDMSIQTVCLTMTDTTNSQNTDLSS